MPVLHTRIRTDRPERYLRQFGEHATAMTGPRGHRMRMHDTAAHATSEPMLRVEQDDDQVTAHFTPWGTCVLHAASNVLSVRIDATDAEALQRIRDIVTRDLERFGRNELIIEWTPSDTPAAGSR
ncbi:DUF2218 domain-containing protein [Nocardia miyunensis]|uniref:DUF2218 domain-containing protein n=1 Tax=Nocardia miyunensis TaxID=282684 RepID=UPI000B016CB6|nr:DUF2218 domain-containing protein [Nocardia miyunensis]